MIGSILLLFFYSFLHKYPGRGKSGGGEEEKVVRPYNSSVVSIFQILDVQPPPKDKEINLYKILIQKYIIYKYYYIYLCVYIFIIWV